MKPALKTALPVGVDEDLRGLPRGYIKNKKDTLDKQADKKKKEKPKKPEKTLKGFETPPAIKKFFAFDKPAAACALALSLLGLLFIYSASSYNAEITFGNPFHYVITQAAALGIGLFLMIAISYFDPTKLVKFRFVILGVSLVLLALVFVPVIGVESYGAKRWLNLGFFTIQPSEFAKFGLVIFIAAQASKKGVSTFKTMLVPLLAGIAVAVLLMLEPNMSITVCVIMVVFIMLFFCGAKISHLAALIVPAFAGGVGLILMEPYRLQRLSAFLNPWASPLEEGYQLIQSYYSLGSGGLFGLGLFNSRQKYMFLPFAESDFIFSIIGEETGLIGCLLVMLLFVFLLNRGIFIATKAKSRFESYLATGIVTMIAVQTAVNVAVVCGAVPPTGLPLPFISSGGTSLVAYLSAVGLLLSVSRRGTEKFLLP